MLDVPPQAIVCCSRLVKSKRKFLFCPKFGGVFGIPEHFQQVQLKKTMKVATFHIWVFLIHSIFFLYNGTAEQASPYIMLRA
jgi:hypothetical protein